MVVINFGVWGRKWQFGSGVHMEFIISHSVYVIVMLNLFPNKALLLDKTEVILPEISQVNLQPQISQ